MTEFPITAKGDADLAGFISAFAAATAGLATFTTVAGTATLAAGTLVLAGLIPAIDAASDFQAEMIKLNTLVGISTELMGDFEDSILQLAPGLGQTPLELAKAMFAITSGGIRSAESVDLLVASAKAARIGLGDVTTIARVSTATLQAFADQNLTAAQAVDIMVGTVREGNLVAEELPNAFGRVIGIAGQMGVTFQEVGTFIATFTRLGVSAEIAATSLRATLFSILNPGKEARDTFDKLGISVQEMRDKIANQGLTSAMLDLLEATEGNLDILSDIIPNIRAMSGVLGVYAAQAEQVVEIQNNMNNIFGVTNEGFDTVQITVKNSFAQLKASISTLAVTVGRPFLPTTKAIIDALTRIAEASDRAAGRLINFALVTGRRIGNPLTAFAEEEEESAEERLARFKLEAREALTGTLLKTLDKVKQSQIELGAAQIDADRDVGGLLNKRVNLLIQQREILEEILGGRDDLNPRLRSLIVSVESTEEDAEAVEKIIDKLRDKLLIEEDLRRVILQNDLAEANATETTRSRALAIFDEIEALKDLKAEEKERLKIQERIEASVARFQERLGRDAVQVRRRIVSERRREEERIANVATLLMIDEINRAMERQQDVMEIVSGSIVDSFEAIIRKTSDVSEAFADMVTNIIAEFARLQLEQALAGFLSSFFFPIPATPGVIPFPDDPTIGLDLPALSRAASGGTTTIVNQNITFAPNLIDGRSGQAFIRENAGEISRIIADSVRTSGDFAATLGR